jgi:predicted ArsR family transcriptional regulator
MLGNEMNNFRKILKTTTPGILRAIAGGAHTVSEIASDAELKPATVRSMLTLLANEGKIKLIGHAAPVGRRIPANMWQVAEPGK